MARDDGYRVEYEPRTLIENRLLLALTEENDNPQVAMILTERDINCLITLIKGRLRQKAKLKHHARIENLLEGLETIKDAIL